jgi:hypothetical protein
MAVLERDANMGPSTGGGPSIIVLPELSIEANDVSRIRGMLRAARPNTLLISGIGHMTAAEIDPNEASEH